MAEVIVNDSGRFLDGYSNVLGAVAVLKSAAEDLDDDALLAVYHHAQQTAKVVERARPHVFLLVLYQQSCSICSPPQEL